jgi:phospholipid-translocating ATPase
MLTGDKVETATCIATSAGFKSKTQQLFFMKELRTMKDAEIKLKEFETKTNNLLMIDGQSLDLVLSSKSLEEKFFSVAT